MPKLTEEQAGLLERILEEGLKAVTGEEIPVTVNLPRREPEYEYVTDGKERTLKQGEYYYHHTVNGFMQYMTPLDSLWKAIPYRRVEKKS